MEMKKTFCEECGDDVMYSVMNVEIESEIKGETYLYHGEKALCVECGEEVYVAEVNDFNLVALYTEYRVRNNIISLKKILEIPEKYAIGKRPLSLLLGWGEQTFSRYCDGDMPTKQYSEILQKIYDDPVNYNVLLENNRCNLKSPISYEKSKKAVNRLLGERPTGNSKIECVIEYVLAQCEDITPLSLQKILYYIQGFHFGFNKVYMFSDECEAWVHGPVYREIYYKYRDYRFDPIYRKKEIDMASFTASEKAILDSVVKNICCYSGKILEKFTHLESPWLDARGELLEYMGCDTVIPKEQIGRYFSMVKEKYSMINPSDIKGYAQDMFQKM